MHPRLPLAAVALAALLTGCEQPEKLCTATSTKEGLLGVIADAVTEGSDTDLRPMMLELAEADIIKLDLVTFQSHDRNNRLTTCSGRLTFKGLTVRKDKSGKFVLRNPEFTYTKPIEFTIQPSLDADGSVISVTWNVSDSNRLFYWFLAIDPENEVPIETTPGPVDPPPPETTSQFDSPSEAGQPTPDQPPNTDTSELSQW